VQAGLKRYRAAVLKAACEGKLVPTDAELVRQDRRARRSYETGEQLLGRILAERRQAYEQNHVSAGRKVRYKEPKQPVPQKGAELPDGWTWATWDQIGLSQNGRPFHSAEYRPEGIKLLRPGNLHVSGKVVWNEANTRCLPKQRADENADLVVRGQEVVMNLTAQSLRDEFLGRVCLTGEGEECLLNQRLARLTPVIGSPQFVLYLLKAWHFRRFVDGLNTGSLIQHMFTSQLAEYTFPLPPLAEQQRIVAEVERRLSVVDELEAVVSANLQRAEKLRQATLQQAFAGHRIP
jgi:type I restriction enzyme S subunit